MGVGKGKPDPPHSLKPQHSSKPLSHSESTMSLPTTETAQAVPSAWTLFSLGLPSNTKHLPYHHLMPCILDVTLLGRHSHMRAVFTRQEALTGKKVLPACPALPWPVPMPRCVRLAARLPVLLELLSAGKVGSSGSSGVGSGEGK